MFRGVKIYNTNTAVDEWGKSLEVHKLIIFIVADGFDFLLTDGAIDSVRFVLDWKPCWEGNRSTSSGILD